MANYNDIQAVKAQVQASGHLWRFNLGELRESIGYDRLGVRVLQEIAKALGGEGLGYFPREVLDDNSWPRHDTEIRVYKKGSAVGETIDAVLLPSNAGDELLRDSAGSEANETLTRIRTLVCD